MTEPMRSLLVTGGTGSLGRAVVAQALKDGWERVCVFSRDEFKQAMMQEQLGRNPRVRFFLGDVRDRSRLGLACWGVDAVIHTAALKWIADGLYNPDEIVQTNVDGTRNVIRAAVEAGVRRVLVVTSDKGCHPANAYGASKFLAEQYAVQANSYSFPRGTLVGAIRYGNVLWSRGSVLHRFREQFRTEGRVRLTDRRMTRFGLRRSEAARHTLDFLARLRGGEVFVLRLPGFRVEEVARAIAACPIEEVGLRAGGEKLHEVLVTEEDSRRTVWVEEHEWTGWVVEPDAPSWTREPWRGRPMPEGFRYGSEDPVGWLGVPELRGLWDEADPGLPAA